MKFHYKKEIIFANKRILIKFTIYDTGKKVYLYFFIGNAVKG